MNTSPKAAILALMMLLTSGCLGAVDDIVDIEDEIVDSVLDWLCLLYTSDAADE